MVSFVASVINKSKCSTLGLRKYRCMLGLYQAKNPPFTSLIHLNCPTIFPTAQRNGVCVDAVHHTCKHHTPRAHSLRRGCYECPAVWGPEWKHAGRGLYQMFVHSVKKSREKGHVDLKSNCGFFLKKREKKSLWAAAQRVLSLALSPPLLTKALQFYGMWWCLWLFLGLWRLCADNWQWTGHSWTEGASEGLYWTLQKTYSSTNPFL